MTYSSTERDLTRAKVQSREGLAELTEKARRLHAMLLEERDPSLLPKRFLTTIYGFSLVQYFIVWSAAIKQGPSRKSPVERWCLGLPVGKAVSSADLGTFEVFQGVFGADCCIENGTMPDRTSLANIIDWLWETPWFDFRTDKKDRRTPHDVISQQLNHWLELVEMVPVGS